MKKHSLFFLLLFGTATLCAQQPKDDELYALTTSVSAIKLGSLRIVEPYLSPFEYTGFQIGLHSNFRRYFNPANNTLSYTQNVSFLLGSAYHPAQNNMMQLFHTDYTFGISRHIRPIKGLMILAGGNWEIDLGGKYLPRNVNNPFVLDLLTNINLAGDVQYSFRLWKQPLYVQYGFQTPLIGYMFVPPPGATYYEIFGLNNIKNTFRFSSLHNKRGWTQHLHIDIPMRTSTLRIGVSHHTLGYTAHNAVYHKSGWLFSFGWLFDSYTFSGNKRKIPANFIRAYE